MPIPTYKRSLESELKVFAEGAGLTFISITYSSSSHAHVMLSWDDGKRFSFDISAQGLRAEATTEERNDALYDAFVSEMKQRGLVNKSIGYTACWKPARCRLPQHHGGGCIYVGSIEED